MKTEADKIRKFSWWHTGVQSGSGEGDMECLSVLRRKPTHRCTVRVMECLSVLRRKPTHRCTVRVIWSACLYWEGSLTGPVGAYHAIECTGFQARVQTMSAWLTTPTTCWTHWRASQSQHTEPAQTSSLCSWAPPLWAILFWLMLVLSVAEKTDIVEVDHLKMCALISWSDDVHDWFMLISKSLIVISRPPQN